MIYIDLDETLVHAVPLRGGGHGKRRVVRCADGAGFAVLERPLAKSLLADCRALAPVAILTTGDQDYAESSCRALGFEVDEILGREKFIREAEGLEDAPLATGICPQAVLIDNAEPTYLYARIKIDFLGIPKANYFKIRTFKGQDPATFAAEWQGILAALRAYFSTRPPPENIFQKSSGTRG